MTGSAISPAADLLAAELLAWQEAAPASPVLLQGQGLGAPMMRLAARLAAKARLMAIQPFRPDWLALRQAGIEAFARTEEMPEDVRGRIARIALLPDRNRQRTRFLIAESLRLLSPSAAAPSLLACQENRHGAKALERDLRQTGGALRVRSRRKCRLMLRAGQPDEQCLHAWREEGAPRRIAIPGIGELFSMPGIFSWDRADPGSLLLLDSLPALAGEVMDLCCGNGLIARALMARHPASGGIARLHLLDADANALACARRNLEGLADQPAFHWLDAASEPLPGGMDAIVCNPPFHRGHARDVALGRRILLQGLRALRKGGRMFIVANRQLAYEKALAAQASKLRLLRQEGGYKIIEAVR